MEFHASKRDIYGIPIIKSSIPIGFFDDGKEKVFGTRNQKEERGRLRVKTENLRRLHYTIDFLEKWISSNLLAKKSRIRTAPDAEDMSRTVDDEIERLEAHQNDTSAKIKTLLDLQRSMAAYLIVLQTDYVPDVKLFCNPFSNPRWLLRVSRDDSYCQYDKNIGILSSGYMRSDPGLCFHDMITDKVISKTSLRNHCEGTEPTPFISMTDDAAWLLYFVKRCRLEGTTRIAFINVKNLELMGVLHGLGRSWAMEAGVELYSAENRDGIHYLGPAHWLAYGWIPVQCIDDDWSLNHFRQVCSECGISEGRLYFLLTLLPSRTDKSQGDSSINRVSAEEVIAKSSNDLSNRLKESLKLQ